MPYRNPDHRVLQARVAAHAKWAQTDPAEGTAAARQAFLDRFDREVPADITDPAERIRRAAHARKAYFTRLALASAKARSKGAA